PVGPPTPAAGAMVLAGGKGQLERELTMADPADRVQLQSRCKVFTISMKAVRTYQIDMIRKRVGQARVGEMDPFLRLEDADGNQLMFDDDGGGNKNARSIFACPRDATFRIVATTLFRGIGPFTLKVEER